MKILTILVCLIFVILAVLFVWSRLQVSAIEAEFPPAGNIVQLKNGKFHYMDMADESLREGGNPNAASPVMFVHGASGNLLDQYGAFEGRIKEIGRALFVDRPGYGYSDRAGADNPAKQAAIYREFLDKLGIEKVVLVGHSLGTASVAAFAVLYPERVKGIVFLSPATHPWPGGVTWYYELTSLPVIGYLFSETVVLPVGINSLESGAKSVFEPQAVTPDYVRKGALALILRPDSFRHNARDVAGLNKFVREFSKRYGEITAPSVVITGNKDDIVSPKIHSLGLERDIEGAELIVLPGIGHKPDYAATDEVVKAINRVSR